MIRIPSLAEWDISAVAVGERAYLASARSFEEISSQAAQRAQIIEGYLRPYMDVDDDDPDDTRDARQAIFVVKIDFETCDLIYNAPDGMRGRYWQSPDHGFLATRHLISELMPKLLAFARTNTMASLRQAKSMPLSDVQASLELPSAKVWPVESKWTDEHLVVRRWADTAKTAWKRGPTGDSVDVKGGLLGLDGAEYIPKHKRDRSCQLFRFGYT